MDKPIIGIIGRKAGTDDKVPFDGNIVVYDCMKPLDKAGASYVGIITNSNYDEINEEILKMCDGFLLPGGTETKAYHYKIIKYAYENKVPFMGICLGCQAIGLTFLEEKKLTPIMDMTRSVDVDHYPVLEKPEDRSIPRHTVDLKEGSILNGLLGSTLETNGKHRFSLTNVQFPLEIVGKSKDGLVEAIELVDKKQFMVGVQWHPENMENMQPIFDELVNRARIYRAVRKEDVDVRQRFF